MTNNLHRDLSNTTFGTRGGGRKWFRVKRIGKTGTWGVQNPRKKRDIVFERPLTTVTRAMRRKAGPSRPGSASGVDGAPQASYPLKKRLKIGKKFLAASARRSPLSRSWSTRFIEAPPSVVCLDVGGERLAPCEIKAQSETPGSGVVPNRFYFNSGHAELIYTEYQYIILYRRNKQRNIWPVNWKLTVLIKIHNLDIRLVDSTLDKLLNI